MRRVPLSDRERTQFAAVQAIALALPGVEAATKYDGSPVLKTRGVFVAGLASHRTAEPESLVVRIDLADREHLLEDAPEAYYVTPYYQPYPVVLVRLAQVNRDALKDLLQMSLRLASSKTRGSR
jgi:hypothetical protein